MSESAPTPVLDPEFVYTIDCHSAPCREIKVEFDHEVSFSTPRYQGTVPRDLLPQVLVRSILHQVVATMLEHAILGESDMMQESKAVVINRFWFKRDCGSVADMLDLIEAEVQGRWMRAGPGKVEMQVRGLAVDELKKFFESL
jgi:hypothetical protein